jgi:methionyl-tRNA formyltransferase
MKRIVFIGNVLSSSVFLDKLMNLNANVVGVVTKEKSFNADHVTLEHDNRFITKNVNDPETVTWIKELSPDYIFCFGFSSLLGDELLSICPIIGFHPAAIQMNPARNGGVFYCHWIC